MDPKPKSGFETDIATIERINVIGREIPLAKDIYGVLSDKKDITARVTDSSMRVGSDTIVLSERELFDDLLTFCESCRDLTVNEEHDNYGAAEAVAGIDEFLDQMVYLTKDMYDEAISGLAEYHGEWLKENPTSKLLFIIPNQRVKKSQAAVTKDIAEKIITVDSGRVQIVSTDDVTPNMVDGDTKIVLSDDWAIMGNHISNDLGKLLAKLTSLKDVRPEDVTIEIELLLARVNQVQDGMPIIRDVIKFMEGVPEFVQGYAKIQPVLTAYFESPVAMDGFEKVTPAPTGSHSSADYNFASRLDTFYQIAKEHDTVNHVPYIATIVPEYST